ncbi:MAG: hypothetical protein WAP57_11755 [Aquabacterium commune]|uniref:hypothetical protein n=1 Tax=Aquabacterium commune TaxID=70586 RepID=UPI003BB19993
MTKDVIELAREAGICSWVKPPQETVDAWGRFAAIVAARERERVANLVLTTDTWRNAGWVSTICPITTQAIAAAIRALNTEGEGNDPITG